MRTNKNHSTKSNKASTSNENTKSGSELKSRSEQLSGNENRQTPTTLPPAPSLPPTQTINNQPSTPCPVPQGGTERSVINSVKRILPYVNFEQRDLNRALATDEVLDMLRQWLPQAYALAEVVGKWVWITFPEPPAEQIRGQLSQFGFHWNNLRQCWQHPCGQFAAEGSAADPRIKYGSHMAAAA